MTDVEAILPLLLLAVLVPLSLLPPKVTALFEVIEALILHRPFTRREVTRITGISLPGHDPGRYFDTFMSDRPANGTILSAEVRVPSSASSKKDGMVVLAVNTGTRIAPAAVMKRFGPHPEFYVSPPEAPFGCTYTYQQPWGNLSFRFTRGPEYLETVVIDAIDPQPAS